ncbi:MAG: hypothetical protein IPG85_07875 [Bacteroidetes bacterium]|nr:hypothetical protein [Bacteroidota bacterium]
MNWHVGTSNGTKAGRTKGLKLLNNYNLHWKEYSTISNNNKNHFKYLMLERKPIT